RSVRGIPPFAKCAKDGAPSASPGRSPRGRSWVPRARWGGRCWRSRSALSPRKKPNLAAFVESHPSQSARRMGHQAQVRVGRHVEEAGCRARCGAGEAGAAGRRQALEKNLTSQRSWNPTLRKVREGWGTKRKSGSVATWKKLGAALDVGWEMLRSPERGEGTERR